MILFTASPVLGQGFMYGARTDKGQYDLGEVIHITIYRGSITDLCIYHIVKCEVYYLGNLVASYGPWDDREVSFPLTVDFTPAQTGIYTIMVRFWHNGEEEETGPGKQVPVNVNVIPEFSLILPVLLAAMAITILSLRKRSSLASKTKHHQRGQESN